MMTEKLDIGLDRTRLSSSCPQSRYELEFTFLQARLEEMVICPCCKNDILLIDENASIERAKRDVDDQLAELEQSLKKLSRSRGFGL
jgi:peptide subunit release factor 1 (eRF1)